MFAWRWSAAWLVAGGLVVAAGCGSDTVLFGGPGSSGTTGSGGASTTSSSGSASGGNGGAGAGGDCVNNDDCAIDAVCAEGVCNMGSCVNNSLPAGTACGDNASCDGNGNCLSELGGACSDGSECQSGQCSDGVCCSGACDGSCEACNLPGQEGSCLPHAAGTDPDMECNPGVCNGALGCVASISMGGPGNQFGRDVAVDSMGNVIVVGEFFQTIALGGQSLMSSGQSDIFVAKFDPNGMLLWANRYGNGNTQSCWSVAVDATDNIIIGGNFSGTVDFGSGILISAGGTDAYVAKLDPAGTALWANRYGDVFDEELRTVAVAPNGDIAVGGFFEGLIDFGAGVMGSAGGWDGYLAVLNANGGGKFSQRYGNAEDQRVYGVTFDAAGNVLLTGRHFGTVDLGGGTLTSAGDRDVFIAKLSPTGSHLWSQQYGDGQVQLAWDVATDAAGNVVVVGYNEGSVDFGGGAIQSNGGADVFVVKLDALGGHLWSNGYGGGQTQQPQAVSIDSAGNVVVVGYANGSINFGAGNLQSSGQEDAFVAKFTGQGQHLWSILVGGGGSEASYGVTTDSQNRVYVVGVHSSGIDFGGGALASVGGYDAFMAVLAP